MAIVSLPYAYRVSGIAPRERAVKTMHVIDTVEVDVPELSDAEVPVAFVHHGHNENVLDVTHRAHEGRPVIRMRIPHEMRYQEVKGPLGIDTVREWRDIVLEQQRTVHWPDYPLAFPRDWNHAFERGLQVHGQERFRSVVQDLREVDRDRAMAIASRMVLVDGALHMPVREAVLNVTVDAARGLVRRVCISPSTQEHPGGEVFRFDRHADALRFARSLVGPKDELDDRSHLGEDLGHIRWSLDDATMAAQALASSLMSALGGKSSHQMRFLDHSFFGPMCELRDLWRRDGSRDAIVACAQRMSTALDASTDPFAEELVVVLRAYMANPMKRQIELEAPIGVPDLDDLVVPVA